ncbi:hypothetical protein D3C72_1581960 [compost metagenome]
MLWIKAVGDPYKCTIVKCFGSCIFTISLILPHKKTIRCNIIRDIPKTKNIRVTGYYPLIDAILGQFALINISGSSIIIPSDNKSQFMLSKNIITITECCRVKLIHRRTAVSSCHNGIKPFHNRINPIYLLVS